MNPFAHFEDQFGHLQLSDNDAALHVFLAGWNSAMMEMMQRVNKMPFGDDIRASFAVYFQSQMVNVDAIEKPAQQEPAGWRPATFHRDNVTFNPVLPDEQTVEFWKLQGVEIEYCYTTTPQRKPLTDDEIGQDPIFRAGVRFAEAAHGIKENT